MTRTAVALFQRKRTSLNRLGIDELNVVTVCRELYQELDKKVKDTLLSLAVEINERESGGRKPSKKWLNSLLEAPDPVALYLYDTEVLRSREYLTEALLAGMAPKKAFNRSLRYWVRLVAHEADRVTDEAALRAYKQRGVKRVRWVTAGDEKVCESCGPMNGKVYEIDNVPAKPHTNCRCWLVPVE